MTTLLNKRAPRLNLQDQHNSIAKFLEAKGMPEAALEVATDAGMACRPANLLA